ncbi:MAG: phosphoglucosamine mutase, partial [Symploca sp. SIO3E6]|nr:phosphoglucosamine mutase [Caldora sp. SIO3E6]
MVTSPIKTQNLALVEPSFRHQQKSSTGLSLSNYPTVLPKTPLFGTDGIRGRAGELLSADLALQVGFWAGQVLQEEASAIGPVVMGQDSRTSGDMLAMALAAGLTSAGLEVWNLGLCTTPGVAYLTAATEAIGGVMISASHNPPEDNGIKFFSSEGAKLSAALQKKIEEGLRGFADNPLATNTWGKHYCRSELIADYVQSLHSPLKSVTDLRGMRIVLDLAWGACTQIAEPVFAELGAEVICLHNQPDGDRINVNCGSTHLDILIAAVQEHSADIGFAFDGDADRVIAVDGQGRVVDGDYILYFWGQTLRQAGKLPGDLIVATVMANLGFERAWQQLGGDFMRTKVGDRYVQAQMLETGAMLGGEQSGHILCHHYSFTGDGLLTPLYDPFAPTRGLAKRLG